MLWFDLDNSPHVPLFRPILEELGKRSVGHFVTAREFAQTRELLNFWNIPHELIGSHAGKNKFKKVLNLLQRSNELVRAVKGRDLTLAVSHGSRTQLLAAKRLGIPSVLMLDYEYTESFIFNMLATHILIPVHIPEKRLQQAGFNLKKVIRYDGFKEEIYLKDFKPDPNFRKTIGIDEQTILVTIRPPSTTGNYHDSRSESLFKACLKHFSGDERNHCLIVNRTMKESQLLPSHLAHKKNISYLTKTVDGLQLIWHSDIVLSGGGTMNRESALLGVPTYSIFTGRRPYLDEYLQERGRLKFLESEEEIFSLPIGKRNIISEYRHGNDRLAGDLTALLLSLAQK